MHCSPTVVYTLKEDYEWYADLALRTDEDEIDDRGMDTQLADYLLDSEIGALLATHVLSSEDASAYLVRDYLDTVRFHRPVRTLTDDEAMFYLLSMAMSDRGHSVESKESRWARLAAKDVMAWQLPGQKVAPGAFMEAFKHTAMCGSFYTEVVRAEKWTKAMENLQYRAQPMWVKYCRLAAARPRKLRPEVAEMVDKADASKPHERHKFHPFGDVGIECDSYNYAGILVIFMGGTQLVFDSSTADYLRTCMTSVRNAYLAFSMLRVAGAKEKINYVNDLSRCIAWIAKTISNPFKAKYTARHMHLAYTRWQNLVGEKSADIDCGATERDATLHKEVLEMYPGDDSWWDLVHRIPCPERVRGEFLKLYHLLPPADIDPLLIHKSVTSKTSAANKADKVELGKFIRFCQAYDFCKLTAKIHEFPKYAVSGDYPFHDTKWAQSCLKGKVQLPPEAEWGKVRISKHFPFPKTGDFHVLNAKDSTRVVADTQMYMGRAFSRSLPKVDNNELLSALFNGEVLSNGELMSEWRARVVAGGLTNKDVAIAAEAGKAENTKVGEKIRETLSACDTVREYFTEVDHSFRPLGEITPGVSMRMGFIRHKKKFQEMARSISKRATRHAFATSTDISAWSPAMPRETFYAWQEYGLSTTQCENPKAHFALWDRLQVFCDRRGVKEIGNVTNGNIQGWPATSDTVMHAHMLIYWVYKLRTEGVISKGEAAYTLAFIDDAATVVSLTGSIESCVEKAAKSRDMLRDTYLKLGFKMDTVKSFFSSIKFVYLNELYIDGTQVGHGTKTLMRIDKDHTRRFASLQDHVATAFGTASSASNNGADPFVGYWMALQKSLMWAAEFDPRIMSFTSTQVFMYCMTPATLNGLGVKPITATLTTGVYDQLTWFIEVAGSLVHSLGSTADRRVMTAILRQEPSTPTASSACKTPFAYKASAHQDASGRVADAFLEAARKKGMAEPFRTLDADNSGEHMEEVLKECLEKGTYEAGFLEEVMANMPGALVDQVLARVEKTEIVAYMLGGKKIGTLRRMVTRADRYNIRSFRDLLIESMFDKKGRDDMDLIFGTPEGIRHGGTSALPQHQGIGPYEYAKRLRDARFQSAGLAILNHTYPCPFAMWAFHGPVNLDEDRSRTVTTVSFDPKRLGHTVGSSTINMYDSRVDGLGFKGFMSSRADVQNELRVALHDPVRRMVASGLAAFRWADATGSHYRGLYRTFLWAWGGHIDERLIYMPGRHPTGSVKRLSLRHSKASHLSTLFLNTQSAVRVDAKAITAAQANKSNMYDMMTAISLLRTSGLLEASLGFRNGDSAFAYGFGYLENASAPVVAPSGPELDVDLDIIKKVCPFTRIDTAMSKSAAAVCNYDGMSEVLATYTAVSEAAAERAFKYLVDTGVMSEDVVRGHDVEVLIARELVPVKTPDPSAWVTRVDKRRVQIDPVVTEVGGASYPTAAMEVPLGTVDDKINHVAKAWDDTLLLEAVCKNAMFVEALRRLQERHSVVGCLELEEWDEWHHILIPHDRQLRAIINEVAELVPAPELHATLATVFRKMGCPGLRSYTEVDDSDTLHWLKSFLGTVAVYIARASHVGSMSNRLRRGTTENYARVVVAEAKNKERTRSRVVKAQWYAAAARRQYRAKDMARSRGDRSGTTQMNYESVYLRAAASLLTTRAVINLTAFYGSCITRTIESLSKHISGEDECDEYDDALEGLPYDLEAMCSTSLQAEEAIMTAARVAAELAHDVDVDAIVDAFRLMCEWLNRDLSGDHVSTPVIQRTLHRRSVISSASAFSLTPMGQVGTAAPAVAAAVPVPAAPAGERLLNMSIGVVGISQDATGGVWDEPPENVAQWAWTVEEVRKHICTRTGASMPNAVWDIWGKSAETYKEILQEIVEMGYEYEDQEYSMFDTPSWEADFGAIVEN